jgi:hypothetical protein
MARGGAEAPGEPGDPGAGNHSARGPAVSFNGWPSRRHAVTVVHVTHSDHEAARADRVVRLSRGTIVSDRLRRDDRQPAGQSMTKG